MARAYQVTVGGKRRFAANQTDARHLKYQLAEAAGGPKRAGDIEEVEVPTGKAELIPFLNELIEGVERAEAGG